MLKGVRVLEDVSSKHYFEEASWFIRQRFKHIFYPDCLVGVIHCIAILNHLISLSCSGKLE